MVNSAAMVSVRYRIFLSLARFARARRGTNGYGFWTRVKKLIRNLIVDFKNKDVILIKTDLINRKWRK